MKTAIIYVRVSDKKQVEKNLSIPAQVEACENHAEKLKLKVAKVFSEEGKSAWYGNRPEFEDAIVYCEVNEIDYFITWDTARFSRDHVNGPLSRYRLRSAGTKIEYLTVDIDPETDGGFILETVYQLTDELKSRKTSADTKRSMMKNATEGFFNGGRPPFGFKVVESIEDSKRKKLKKDMLEVPIVINIFNLRISGFGGKLIADKLNNEGITNRGRRWNKSTILSLLRNDAVIGKTIFNRTDRRNKVTRKREDWIIVESHEPIINIDVWNSVQSLMDSAITTNNSSSPHSTRLLTGLLKCGVCSASIQVETAKGRSKSYSYYNCRNKQKNNTCDGHRIRTELLDEFVLNQIINKIFNKTLLFNIASELKKVSGSWHTEQRKKINVINSRLLSVKNKRKKIYQILENSTPDELNLADVKPRLTEHNKTINELEAQLQQAAGDKPPQIPVLTEDLNDLLEVCRSFILNTRRVKEVRGFLSSFIDKIIVNADEVKIYYKPDNLIAAVSGNEPRFIVSPARGATLPYYEPLSLSRDGRSLLKIVSINLSLPESLCKAA